MAVRDRSEGLVTLGDGAWAVQHHRATSYLHVRLRMGVVALPTGGLLLYSPVPIDDALADDLARLGPVEHIVAPNKWHHLHAAAAKLRYPAATLWAAPGLRDKRKDVAFDADLSEA